MLNVCHQIRFYHNVINLYNIINIISTDDGSSCRTNWSLGGRAAGDHVGGYGVVTGLDARNKWRQDTGRVPVQRPQSLRHGRTADGRAIRTWPPRNCDQPVPATQRQRRRRRPVRGRGRVGLASASHQPAERDQGVRAPRRPGYRALGPVPNESPGVRSHIRTPTGPCADPRAPHV